METPHQITFDRFSLDVANECLRQGSQAIRLRPKAFAVLAFLIARPGQLVTKENLLNAVWPETFVGEAVLKVTIRQIREALADDPKAPRFIETAHRRGYRFIGAIAASARLPNADQAIRHDDSGSGSAPDLVEAGAGLVGREAALSRLHGWLEKVGGGERQIVFVTGEAGIGKTALVDSFVRGLGADRKIRISRGQCLEQYGTNEAYLPVLEAIGRLCREHAPIVEVLRAHAPMWLLQLPALVSAADREALNREVFGATRERMLREMAETLEVLTADIPLLLVLEDIHWSDYSTLDLISYLARQRQAARLMVIGTCRTAELIASGHPLKGVKQELLAKRLCEELPLDYLSQGAVTEYLAARFPSNRFPTELAVLIHERTEGNPLFMVNTLDYLVAERLVGEHDAGWDLVTEIDRIKVGVPDSIRHMIEKQLDRLEGGERRLLEAASVSGAEFSALAVAAGLADDLVLVESRCDDLARRTQFIHDAGVLVLPNGEAVGRYGFVHALYRQVLYERMSPSRRIHLHRRIGEGGEELYRERAGEIAAELAMHFERAGNYTQAVTYLQQAAKTAARRFAYQEAVVLSRRGLELLERLPDTAERDRQELKLQINLGASLIATEGYAAPGVGTVYIRARQLCQRLAEPPEISQVLWGLWTFHTLRGDLATALTIAREFLQLVERLPYPELAMQGHWAMGITFTHLGEHALTLEHFDQALRLYDPEQHRDDAFLYAPNPGVAMRCFAAWTLWFIGQPDQAVARIQEALHLARELSEPHGLAHALLFAAILHQLRREAPIARELSEAGISVSAGHGLVMYQAMGTTVRGWTLTDGGDDERAIEEMREGLAALQTMGALLLRPHFLSLLAAASELAGRVDEGLALLDDALAFADATGEHYYLAELHRVKGEQLLAQAVARVRSPAAGAIVVGTRAEAAASAEACFHQSIAIARRQGARSLELRAVLSLARLYQDRGQDKQAVALLAPAYGYFTEGFDTADLRDAKALLERLS